jgi:hypothetical protein
MNIPLFVEKDRYWIGDHYVVFEQLVHDPQTPNPPCGQQFL